MDKKALQHLVDRLSTHREEMPWAERAAIVPRLLGKFGRVRPLTGLAAELLLLLATDPKWEVRKQLADQMHRLGDSDFTALAARLTGDENAFVHAAAERAVARRRSGRNHAARKIRGLENIEDELRRIEVRQGPEAVEQIRDTAQGLYEGLVGASVHELRSVVTAMKTNVENLERCREDEIPAMTRRIIPRLTDRLSYMERLLNDMKEFTTNTSRARASEPVADLVAEALEIVRSELSGSKRNADPVEVRLDLPAELIVHCSRMPMVVVLRNLLKNAIESFMIGESDFEPGVVEVAAFSEGEEVCITIRDQGMGMSPQELENVLRLIPGSSSKGRHGTGFGLPIACRHIRAHGGSVDIASQEDDGTLVTIRLPKGGGGRT